MKNNVINQQFIFVYDLETYEQIFTFCIGDIDGNVGTLECSRRKNELMKMVEIMGSIKDNNGTMIGFNNVGFDYPILHEILISMTPEWFGDDKGADVASFVAAECRKIFTKPRGSFGIFPSEIKVHQTDLYLIHHFNNQARSTGLKALEFAMRMDNIQDLPYPPDSEMSDQMMDELVAYNEHDVKATTDFLKHTEDDIRFRNQLSLKYDMDFTNFNDTKIGKQIFIQTLEADTPGICYEKQGRKRIPRRTFRETLALDEVIHPSINFISPELSAVVDWMRAQVLMSRYDREVKNQVLITKDVFTKIDLMNDATGISKFIKYNTKTQLKNSQTDQVMYTYRNEGSLKRIVAETKKIEDAGCRADHIEITRVAPNLTATIKGFEYVFGLGGIHGSVENKFIQSDDEWVVMDIDVVSYYPSLAIQSKAYPEHLGEKFTDIYVAMRDERLTHAKGTTENAALKLGLNGTYGDSNSKFSPFYDPAFTMKITLNGQLLLAQLSEKLVYDIETLRMIQINTDGMTVKIRRDDAAQMVAICMEWEKRTGLELEYQPYNRMWVSDVNNYIAEKPDRGLKLKGRYLINRDWSQNHSELVVPKAAVEYLVNDVPIDYSIEQCADVYDFMLFAKATSSQRLELWDGEDKTPVQKNSRYFVSLKGGDLKRVNPPLTLTPNKERPISLKAGFKVTIANTISDDNTILHDIDMDYYHEQVEKITQFEEM